MLERLRLVLRFTDSGVVFVSSEDDTKATASGEEVVHGWEMLHPVVPDAPGDED